MTLNDIYLCIKKADLDAKIYGDAPISAISFDSRDVTLGAMFTCKGEAFKPEYIVNAAQNGACAYMSQIKYKDVNLPCIIVKDIRKAMSIAAMEFYGRPTNSFNLIGVTGTKGKTTVTYFLNNIFNLHTGVQNAAITTVQATIGSKTEKTVLTTPEAYDLQKLLLEAKQANCRFFTMEVSSQALKVDRVYGMRYDVGVFTNIDEDHISPSEHPDWHDYFASKLKLFDLCDTAIVNLDCPYGKDAAKYAAGCCKRVITYGSTPQCDYKIIDAVHSSDSLSFDIVTPLGARRTYTLPMHGRFNASNALAAIAAAECFGVGDEAIRQGLAQTRVPGRMNFFYNKQRDVYVVVDFAHNRLSFESLFNTIKEDFPHRRIGVVLGSDGGKAFGRRKAMGEAIEQFADYAILTDSDSNYEDTHSICEDILQYVKTKKSACRIIVDRQEAVTTALNEAQPGDIIALLARGEETRRWWNGQVLDCVSDVELARRYAELQ